MKTPKRNYKRPKFSIPYFDSDWLEDYFQQQETRWKRKNRIKQLKKTIAKKEEVDMYWVSLKMKPFEEMMKKLWEKAKEENK